MDLIKGYDGMAGLECNAAQVDKAPMHPAPCWKNAVPLACVLVSFSINFRSALDRVISIPAHFLKSSGNVRSR